MIKNRNLFLFALIVCFSVWVIYSTLTIKNYRDTEAVMVNNYVSSLDTLYKNLNQPITPERMSYINQNVGSIETYVEFLGIESSTMGYFKEFSEKLKAVNYSTWNEDDFVWLTLIKEDIGILVKNLSSFSEINKDIITEQNSNIFTKRIS